MPDPKPCTEDANVQQRLECLSSPPAHVLRRRAPQCVGAHATQQHFRQASRRQQATCQTLSGEGRTTPRRAPVERKEVGERIRPRFLSLEPPRASLVVQPNACNRAGLRTFFLTQTIAACNSTGRSTKPIIQFTSTLTICLLSDAILTGD